MDINRKMNTVELFAGVGGFRVGLEKANPDFFNVVWGNQWEPSKKAQDAFDCYASNFDKGIHSNEDITKVSDESFKNLDAKLVVGGFPCQDYSVARSLSGEKGIQGKKGVLFWEIRRVIEATSPRYVLLENVDRLLKSPASQRGRDFAVMLATFRDLGYKVEWRVINAAEYGQAQRRRRVFIFATRNDTGFSKELESYESEDILFEKGFFSPVFPVKHEVIKNRKLIGKLPDDIVEISDSFSASFYNSGYMHDGNFYSIHTEPVFEKPVLLRDILQPEETVPDKFYLSESAIEKFNFLRGAKKIERTSVDGHKYIYSEGGMSEIDDLDKPGRTMLTSEGTTNRSSHVVEVDGRRRFLTPLECERLNGFPDNWTNTMSDRMRYFCMGNALVVGLIERMGKRIEQLEIKHVEEIPLQEKLFLNN
ncbi:MULTISPECIES: DNA (cytosine-5-)-methyltransferase [Exiguobacterium]|uniref:DNA (cytosine-5-)-methyltransferase n=1 Tax=Exiguobacterium TaxID=33986 RepID=UPI001AEA5C23|nr:MULTISPECIES: DNA (cytosine-5-)-methyltransferase [Exiguobacterium]MCT4780723.1 DNA (cytosine-5-)-methyltransferase [Exiguobacterium soli]